MHRTSTKIIMGLASALVVAAFAAPSAATARALRSPDARDAAPVARTATAASVDLRSPDARDAAVAAQGGDVDLRSPDARDAGRLASSPSTSLTPGSDSTGTDWGDLRIVAGGVLGLVLIGVGGVVLHTRRRGTVRKHRSAVVSS